MSNPLQNYFSANQGKIIQKWIHYFDIYHKHFERFRGKECKILEIGISKGGSLEMWKHYFGSSVKIYGIDIDPACKQFEDESVEIFIGSQSDREFLRYVKNSIPKVDILIDDGGHRMDEQRISFEELYDHVKENGVYLCEDLHTSYWKEYGGGYKKQDSFIEYTKDLIDHLNAWHIREGQLSPSQITRTAKSFHHYDSVFVIEKGKREKPWEEMRGSYPHPYESIDQQEFQLFMLKLKLLGIKLPENLIPEFLFDNPHFMDSLYPEKYQGKNWPEKGETMIGFQRLSNLQECVKKICHQEIEGDFVEAGVWRGGASIFLRALMDAYTIKDKKVWLADSFQGLPPPDEDLFPEDEGLNFFEYPELAVSIDEVKGNFRKYNLLDHRVEFLEGWFKDTLPSAPVKNISLLRLDADLYESTLDALLNLYPKLSIGGYCVVDDWGAIPACRKAVEDYRTVFRLKEDIYEIDWTGVYWQKEKKTKKMSREDFLKALQKKKNGAFNRLLKHVNRLKLLAT